MAQIKRKQGWPDPVWIVGQDAGALSSMGLEIARGNIAGYSSIHKFGHNPDIDTAAGEDVWTLGGLYAFPSDSGAALEIVSSAADAVSMVVQGLDENFALKQETVTLNGVTPVALTGLWSRVFRSWNDSATALTGDVSIRASGGGTTFAQVRAEEQQTSMAIYTVPAGKTGYLMKWYASINRNNAAGAADAELQTRLFGKAFREKEHIGINGSGNSSYIYDYTVPLALPEKTDIKVFAEVTANNSDIAAGFDIILINN